MQGDLNMVANAGTVKGKLILDTTDFTAKWKKILNDVNTSVRPKGLDSIKKQLSDVKEDAKQMANSTNSSLRKMEGDFQSYFSKVKNTAQGASSSVKNSLNTINNTRFDKLNNNLDSVIRRMQNSSSSGVRAIGNKLETGLNSIKFDNLSTRFSATIQKMQSSASAGVKSISNSFSSMEAGINDIFATVAGGAGAYELFNYGMGKATTTAMLSNSKSKADAATIMSQYQKYTVASSTSDSDINNILKYVVQSAKPTQTYKALNAIDAAAYTTDPIQRQELLRNFGNYLTNGYSAALFKGDVTADQAKILAAAKTPEERIAAMEQIAKQKGSMTADGQNLSTEKTGPLGKYNKLLTASDTLMRGMADGLEKLLTTAEPLLDWFNGLDSGTQTFIGNLITFGAAITAVSGGVRVLGSLLKPLGPAFSLVKKGIGKLGDITGVTDKLSGLKNSIKTKVGDAFSGAGETAKNKLKNVKTKIGDALNGSDTTASNKLKNVKTKIGDALKGAADTASSKMTDVKNAITGKLGDLKDWIKKQNWTSSSTTTPGTSTKSAALQTLALTAGVVYLTAATIDAASFGRSIYEQTGSPGASLVGGIEKFQSDMPLQMLINTAMGTKPITAESAMADWKTLSKGLSGFGGLGGINTLLKGGGLFGTASASNGKISKSSISNDIFGKNGLLDFNRGGSGFKIPKFTWPKFSWPKITLPSFKWPKISLPKWGWPKFSWPKVELPNWKWPSFKWPKVSIPHWSWPSFKWPKVSIPHWSWPSFHWSIPSWQSILRVISSRIPTFRWPTGPGGTITGIIHRGKSAISAAKAKAAAAKNVATSVGSRVVSAVSHPVSTIKRGASWLWNKHTGGRGPRGPYDNIKNILDDTYSGLSYMDYPGTRGATLNQILNSGGNCMDLTMAGMTQLAGIGIPSEMVWGSWNGNSHVWLRAPGLGDYDPARQILNHTSTPPARGPGNNQGNTIIIEKGACTITGPVYGIDDLDTKMEEKFIKLANRYLA